MEIGFGIKTANWGGADGGAAPRARCIPGGIAPGGRLKAVSLRVDGTAINAARGSSSAIGAGSAGATRAAALVGGGAIGLAISSGFSPGKTQTFRSLS